MTKSETDLRERFEAAGQGHVFAFWKELDSVQRARFAHELRAVDLPLVSELAELARRPTAAQALQRFDPPHVFPLSMRAGQGSDLLAVRALERGADLLRDRRVAYVLVAGGQASRLGYEGPKGAFPVGPVSGRSLFEVFARRLIAARDRFGAPPRWYVMTSQANDAATRAFFEANRWFGLAKDDVFFFEQAMLPALDESGRILLAAKDALFLAPNGHGGVLSAFASSGALAHARERGVDVLSYFQVDNPLAPPADPLFLGLHALEGAQMSSKIVQKRDAHEKVGVIGRVDGKLSCIEYSDMPADLREARDERGALLFGAGNIALHALDLAFVDTLTRGGLRLPWHVARKTMTALDASGVLRAHQGFKFETFVFDALALAERTVTLEVDRKLEFSPVKNATGEDSPLSARTDLCRLFSGWVASAGLPLPPPDEHGLHPVEIDPVLAEDAATFRAKKPGAPRVSDKGHLYS
jgi:UDP-N-acetylglucosamine/UDP-N-acetylgalactosamine diphosphorylase